jgi:hypothetical protein
MKQISGVDE